MKKEQRTLFVSAIINIIVFVLKIIGGMLFNCYALIADGIYTLSDFTTDILAMIGARVGKKRANKKYPFGYGRFEYIMQVFIGILIMGVGIFIAYKSLFIDYSAPDLKILWLVVLTILLKGLSSSYLMHMGKKISSLILVSSAKESFLDVLSTIMISFAILFGQIIPSIDIVASLFIALLILYEGGKIIFDNVLLLIGEDDNNSEMKGKIKSIINQEKDIEYADSFLISCGNYYQATIQIAVDDDMTVKSLLKKELNIKKKIKRSKLGIKFIDFDVIKR